MKRIIRTSRLHALAWIGILLSANALVADIRVATYNVRNYLLTNRPVKGEGAEKPVWREDYPKPENEKKALRRIIAKEEPDILAIQEMGGEPFLRELQRDLKNVEGADYPYTAWMEGADPDRHVVVMSKVPFSGVERHAGLEYKYFEGRETIRRGLLEVQFKTGNTNWSLFTVHLKSKFTIRDDDPESRIMREGEARAIRDFIKKKYPVDGGYPYLLVGDFNDTPNSKPVTRILKSGSTRLSQYLLCQDNKGRIWTHFWNKGGTYAQIDYIFASPAMLGLLPEKELTKGMIEDSEDTLVASDHRMVSVMLPFEP
jgi:endonuclease/exonuclease/phosphatase family metal-dependent hydrolase